MKNPLDSNCWSSNYWIWALVKGGFVDIWHKSKICQGLKLFKTLWCNGSGSDSRSEGCMFKSCRDQQIDIFKFPLHLQSKVPSGNLSSSSFSHAKICFPFVLLVECGGNSGLYRQQNLQNFEAIFVNISCREKSCTKCCHFVTSASFHSAVGSASVS